MSPRPILKRSPSDAYPHHPDNTHHHAVHFPPSPSLTRIFSAHSPQAYDRSPIVVSPNSCALPERGCPGRTYTLDDPASSSSQLPRRACGGREYHPRAMARTSHSPDSNRRLYQNLPPLIPDLSSESDESDSSSSHHELGLSGPSFLSPQPPNSSRRDVTGYVPVDMYDSTSAQPPLSFLPHPPSAPINPAYPSYSQYPTPMHEGDNLSKKPRRRRGERERKHESSDDPGRIRNIKAISSFSISDDGCLGGF